MKSIYSFSMIMIVVLMFCVGCEKDGDFDPDNFLSWLIHDKFVPIIIPLLLEESLDGFPQTDFIRLFPPIIRLGFLLAA